jgi:hypothetical protein
MNSVKRSQSGGFSDLCRSQDGLPFGRDAADMQAIASCTHQQRNKTVSQSIHKPAERGA